MMKARVGDSVLVRLAVVDSVDDVARVGVEGFLIPVRVDNFDIVAVEPVFKVGDNVKYKDSQEYGKIVALSPDGHEPKQAWIQVVGKWPLLVTRDLRSLTRDDS